MHSEKRLPTSLLEGKKWAVWSIIISFTHITYISAGRGGSVRVLLCTDNPEVRRYMRSRGIICAQPPLISRDKYLQALFEMMLLSSCDLVIGRSLSHSLARAPPPPLGSVHGVSARGQDVATHAIDKELPPRHAGVCDPGSAIRAVRVSGQS